MLAKAACTHAYPGRSAAEFSVSFLCCLKKKQKAWVAGGEGGSSFPSESSMCCQRLRTDLLQSCGADSQLFWAVCVQVCSEVSPDVLRCLPFAGVMNRGPLLPQCKQLSHETLDNLS